MIPATPLRRICRRLRALEDAITAQRKRIAVETCERRLQVERATLARLLNELDRLLVESDLTRAAAE